MGSVTEADVIDYLKKTGREYIKSVRIVEGNIFLTVDAQKVAAVAHEARQTSRRQLGALTATVQKQFGMDAQFSIFSDEASHRIEVMLRELLTQRFPDDVSDVTASLLDAESATVWVDAEAVNDMAEVRKIEEVARNALVLANLPKSSVHVQAPVVDEPTLIAILKEIKLLAPVTLSELMMALSKNFFIPSEHWLASKLDLIRKRGLIVREHNGRFYLSEQALTIVPHGRAKNSSDIVRALRLMRRGWR